MMVSAPSLGSYHPLVAVSYAAHRRARELTLALYTKTPPGTVRLFDRSDYYSAFGTDAIYVATNHYKVSLLDA